MIHASRFERPSFNVDHQLSRPGRVKALYDLLVHRYHTDPDPHAKARGDIEHLLGSVFEHVSMHYQSMKNDSLKSLIDLQARALTFYQGMLRARGKPDLAALEKLLRDMDTELANLSRRVDEIVQASPPPTLPPLRPAPPKTWDDPDLTFHEFAAAYRARFPSSPLSDPLHADSLRKHYDAKRRLDPDTSVLREPGALPSPAIKATLPTDAKRIADWNNYTRGGAALPCFPAGVVVHTPSGTVAIELLSRGDMVFAWDERERKVTVRAVARTFRNWTRELVVISTRRGTIETTRSHRFWSEGDRAWIAASELVAGASLRLRSGEVEEIIAVDRSAARSATYNLEVAGDHTYFVGDAGLLVHNEEDASAFESRDARYTEIYEVRDRDTQEVVYVGQSVQGLEERLGQHINDPNSVLYIAKPPGSPPLDILDPQNPYEITRAAHGTWTPYEAAVWEQYFIDSHGGKRGRHGRASGSGLLNRQDAITMENFGYYRNLHNPC